jgi:hypothetical protein
MDKIVINNETYYINNGRVYDQSFLETPKDVARKIWECWLPTLTTATWRKSSL